MGNDVTDDETVLTAIGEGPLSKSITDVFDEDFGLPRCLPTTRVLILIETKSILHEHGWQTRVALQNLHHHW